MPSFLRVYNVVSLIMYVYAQVLSWYTRCILSIPRYSHGRGHKRKSYTPLHTELLSVSNYLLAMQTTQHKNIW
ncbi:hypothetical protein F4825DRAFT_433770 [Nemania diffusa]|nr:hypothetical protein F4825DRAFT_433770 [Nemania diffusa]